MCARLLFILLIISAGIACSNADNKLVAIRSLPYPSGSGLAYHNGRLYVMGDDAPYLLVTDSLFNSIDSIQIFETSEKRIEKNVKPDTEAIAFVNNKNNIAVMLFGSGSLSPSRDSLFVLSLAGKKVNRYSLDTFYTRLKNAKLSTLNIEGAAAIPEGLLLANRGNKSFPKNHLIITSNGFWENQSTAGITLVKTGSSSSDTSMFNGISGIDYSYRSDRLFITISTENTYSAYEDGEIGQSFLWIINDFSSKMKLQTINPDKIINLADIDHRFNGKKIESVCVVSEHNRKKVLVLTADDDKGGTVLFRLELSE